MSYENTIIIISNTISYFVFHHHWIVSSRTFQAAESRWGWDWWVGGGVGGDMKALINFAKMDASVYLFSCANSEERLYDYDRLIHNTECQGNHQGTISEETTGTCNDPLISQHTLIDRCSALSYQPAPHSPLQKY